MGMQHRVNKIQFYNDTGIIRKLKKKCLDLIETYLGREAGDEDNPEANRLKTKRNKPHSSNAFESLTVDS